MSKRYATLLPGPLPSDSSDPSSSSTGSSQDSHKRKRKIVVGIACNACRRRKTRCDGRRPICVPCEERAEECVYESKDLRRNRDHEQAYDLVEAIQILNTMPPQRAISYLAMLKDVNDAPTIIASLRDGISNLTVQPSIIMAMSGTIQQPPLLIELQSRYPFTYPVLDFIDISSPQSPFWQLTKSTGEGFLDESFSASIPTSPAHQGIMDPSMPRSQQLPWLTPLFEQLKSLKISRWTNVPITDDFASRIISMYLSTDNPLLCPFHPRLFIYTLVTMEGEYCSRLLINSLMYWACMKQMYNSLDNRASSLVDPFCKEAEKLWEAEQLAPSVLTMAATQFLSFGYLVQGKNHIMLKYISDAARIGTHMGLFGVTSNGSKTLLDNMTPAAAKVTTYATWGVFNWITLMGLFYHQPGLEYLKHAPVLPLPDDDGDEMGAYQELQPEMAALQRSEIQIFRAICQFWRIMHDIGIVYYSNHSTPLLDRVTPQFAEQKYRELLEWAHNLPLNMARSKENSHHLVILHMWHHAAILDIFRPFLRSSGAKKVFVTTFSSSGNTPDAIFTASIQQLKRLIVMYRVNYTTSTYSILWHTALLYLANAMLHQGKDADRNFYFLLCLYGYESLRPSYRVSESIVGGLLSMAMRNGSITSDKARQVLADLKGKGRELNSSEIRATFMVDLDLAMSDPEAAKAETLAGSFEDNAMMLDYTTVFEDVS